MDSEVHGQWRAVIGGGGGRVVHSCRRMGSGDGGSSSVNGHQLRHLRALADGIGCRRMESGDDGVHERAVGCGGRRSDTGVEQTLRGVATYAGQREARGQQRRAAAVEEEEKVQWWWPWRASRS
jgi:hypothetical protein